MAIGTGYPITVTNGIAYTGDQCGIWADWNKDGDFLDAGETIAVSSGPSVFTATITPPAGAVLGATRMRVRITYTGTVSSCGTTQYGEVEDYTINVSGCSPPTPPTGAWVNRDNFCTNDPGDITLSAGGGSGTTMRWFTGSCGGTSIGTGSALVIASPTTTTTYYVRWENSCGNSSCLSVVVTVNTSVAADFNGDCCVDALDAPHLLDCATGPNVAQTNGPCLNARLDSDEDVDADDLGIFQRCFSGTGNPPDPNCAQ